MDPNTVRRLFPQLLKNGYVPLPNWDKACYLPRWSTILVDEEQCKRWTRQTRWPAIGLRVEPPLLVLDYDIPDLEILQALEAATPTIVFDGLERQGSPPKTAFFLRLNEREEPFHEAHTRRYMFAGAPKPVFAVQAFAGGGGGRQFGAFGPHSHDVLKHVLKRYSWVDGRSPATVPINELPELTRAQVFALLDAADAVLANRPGLVVDQLSKSGEKDHQSQVYDLTEATVFHDTEGVEYSFEELVAEAKARKELGQADMRITGSFTGDPTSVGSPRAKVHWNRRNGISVVDFKTDITHRALLNTEDPELQQLLDEVLTKRALR